MPLDRHGPTIDDAAVLRLQIPAFLEDELLLGWISRFACMSFRGILTQAFAALLSMKVIPGKWLLPSRLAVMASRLSDATGLSTDDLIYKHTLFPLFAPFIKPVAREKIHEGMLGSEIRSSPWSSLGIMGRGAWAKPLAFCENCSTSDLKCNGHPYFRRVDQIPGFTVCAQCGSSLVTFCGRCSFSIASSRICQLPASECPCGASLRRIAPGPLSDLNRISQQRLLNLARSFLSARFENSTPVILRRVYIDQAKARGFYKGSHLNHERLLPAMRERTPDDLRKALGALSSGFPHWLRRMFSHERPPTNFAHHLLVIDILFEDFTSFKAKFDAVADGVEDAAPPPVNPAFRTLHWCLSHVSTLNPSFSKEDVLALTGYKKRKGRGTKETRIRNAEFLYRILQGESPEPTANELGMSVRSALVILNKNVHIADPWRLAYIEIIRSRAIAKIREAVDLDENATISKLIKQRLGNYITRLQIVDPSALSAMISKESPFDLRKATRSNIDTEFDDAMLAGQVRTHSEAMLRSPGRPVRLTATRIAATIRRGREILSGASAYPRTRAALRECADTEATFTARRVVWAREHLPSLGMKRAIAYIRSKTLVDLEARRLLLGGIESKSDSDLPSSAKEFSPQVRSAR